EPSVHAPVDQARSCVNCHDPHGAVDQKLLLADERQLCLRCHEPLDRHLAQARHVHRPIGDGLCTVCHEPHRSPDSRFLRYAYPRRIKLDYDPANFQLCFSCHDSGLVDARETSTTTSFRDGTRNLHHVHVVENGRTCRACHDVHGSVSESLVRERLPFGSEGWEMPIEYRRAPDGGTCTLSCHVERTYRR
ncbi:MAG: cytochrome C, partial [Planctomycetes bacterium]|nr:cytochrome C [Planctomycetota bacterium]